MIRFIPARDLKTQFGVFGHFYSVQIAPHKIVECRSVLELVAFDDLPRQTDEISGRRPDAVFIMMNPGSSRPLVEVNNHLKASAIQKLTVSLVPTKPDTTQYQVMRIMHYCGWRHVRVLNLSDLRCAQSGLFVRQFAGLEQGFSFDAHSLFSDRRTAELAVKLTQHASVPVVRAWGVSPHLEPLIERCLSKLTRCKDVRGLLKEGTTNKFLHPLPSLQSQQMLWVQRMVEQCQG